jgi:phosphate starvation-inducible protein PhoH
MNQEINNIITLFQKSADLLNLQKSKEDLDDAISILASWMQLNAHELTEDDFVALTLVGGIIYRAGLYRTP